MSSLYFLGVQIHCIQIQRSPIGNVVAIPVYFLGALLSRHSEVIATHADYAMARVTSEIECLTGQLIERLSGFQVNHLVCKDTKL